MDEMKKIVEDLRKICESQYIELEIKKIQLMDVEEENKVLSERVKTLTESAEKDKTRIEDLERWCGHLQGIIDANTEKLDKLEKRFGIFYKIAKKLFLN